MKDLIKRDEDEILSPLFDGIFNFTPFKREIRDLEKNMKTDIKETENSYEFEIEIPGYEKGDISLELNDGYLTVKAEKSNNVEEKDKKGNYIRRERKFGMCSRSFYVGNYVKEEDIDAKLEHGVLEIKVPKEKPQLENKKHIEIK